MKKALSLLLALVMCLSLCACGGGNSNTPDTPVGSNNPVVNDEASQDSGQYVAYSYDGEPTDLLTIEEVILMPERWPEILGGDLYLNWKVKVRNTSGEDIGIGSYMCIWYSFLDENEDIVLADLLMGDSSVSTRNGKAEWLQYIHTVPAGWTNEICESIAYIEIYGYAFSDFSKPQYIFEEPVLIDLREFFDWDNLEAFTVGEAYEFPDGFGTYYDYNLP